jgi:hypothetical protein
MQEIFGIPIAFFVLPIEIFILALLIIGWVYGSRRRAFSLHHRAVWLVVLLHIVTVGVWMIPQALIRLSIALSNPLVFWYQIVHDFIGILAIGLGAILVVIFLIKGGMPWKLIRRTKSLMILTISIWIIAFILGVYWFLVSWVL